MNLAGLTEIAEMLGVSRQRVSQLSTSENFPAPLDRLAMGPVWNRVTVERWAEKNGRTNESSHSMNYPPGRGRLGPH